MLGNLLIPSPPADKVAGGALLSTSSFWLQSRYPSEGWWLPAVVSSLSGAELTLFPSVDNISNVFLENSLGEKVYLNVKTFSCLCLEFLFFKI